MNDSVDRNKFRSDIGDTEYGDNEENFKIDIVGFDERGSGTFSPHHELNEL